MKHYTDKELKQILFNIVNGTVYCGITKDGYGIGQIRLTPGKHIGWEHYGQSVEKCNIEGLRFVIENIFAECELIAPATWSDYHVGYIPIDKQYKGFDHSFMQIHPNAFGV